LNFAAVFDLTQESPLQNSSIQLNCHACAFKPLYFDLSENVALKASSAVAGMTRADGISHFTTEIN